MKNVKVFQSPDERGRFSQNRHHGGGQDEKTIVPSAAITAVPAVHPRLGGG
jgi:hypothetical protein